MPTICSKDAPYALQGLYAMSYGEMLPEQCPPEGFSDEALDPVFRLVPDATPDAAAFASHNAQGKTKPATFKVTDCQWASCSLNRSVDALLKIPSVRRRYRFVAQLSIPSGSGAWVENDKSGHIDFWRFDHFDPSTAVQAVMEHGR